MIYLNNSATSFPKPPAYADAWAKTAGKIPGHGVRSTYREGKENTSCRQRLAKMLGIDDSRQIIYTLNATHALNMGLLGFPWAPGDVVLTSRAEHNSVLRPLYFLQKKGLIRYYELDTDRSGRLDMAVYREALKTLHPRMVVITHASNVTGAVNDIPVIAGEAKKAGAAVFLDAAQTAGLIPVLPALWGVDMAALTGHKYLLGPQGTGALYVSRDITLQPVYTGGTGIHSDLDEMPEEYPIRLEAGTQNEQGMEVLGEMLAWAEEHPFNPGQILDYSYMLEDTLKGLGCSVVPVSGNRTPVVTFTSPDYSPADIGDMLSGSFDIICRTGLHCAPHIFPCIGAGRDGTVRFSLSRFTSLMEVQEVIGVLKEIFNGN
ncbi:MULTISPECIES: aminotransferase class V-fold PLP-dependent enzyme [Blautia]|uniref:aminotransferase class V-fold PLP-dependent enzyme n=1 Tax=Blautia TaxID=572511 RepID=UPI000BA40CB4|nr:MULTISPECIES: aminotransferase class V-fold PLP-dependent enzyme [Blautia]